MRLLANIIFVHACIYSNPSLDECMLLCVLYAFLEILLGVLDHLRYFFCHIGVFYVFGVEPQSGGRTVAVHHLPTRRGKIALGRKEVICCHFDKTKN